MEGQIDKMNYREDVQLIRNLYELFLRIFPSMFLTDSAFMLLTWLIVEFPLSLTYESTLCSLIKNELFLNRFR